LGELRKLTVAQLGLTYCTSDFYTAF